MRKIKVQVDPVI